MMKQRDSETEVSRGDDDDDDGEMEEVFRQNNRGGVFDAELMIVRGHGRLVIRETLLTMTASEKLQISMLKSFMTSCSDRDGL